ncbi:MAG: nucleotidyltransferase domain-containing protein [Sphingomonadales bacterium]|nr:MAG: nucleotidyltransferase domain-containing protein [Sphingomonadales bacterium]
MPQTHSPSMLVFDLQGSLPREKLNAYHGLALVGSWARGEADAASDVDVLFIGFLPAEYDLVQEIKLRLGQVAPARIDAIKAERLPPKVLASQLADAIHFWPERTF